MNEITSTRRPKSMTLDELRNRARAAIAKLPGSEDLIAFSYLDASGEEFAISRAHFFDDAKCLPGRYVVEIPGQLREEGKLLDPSATRNGETTPNEALSKLLSNVLLNASNSVENAGRREQEAFQQLDQVRKERDQIHHTLMAALARNAHLEAGSGGDKGLAELRDVFMVLLQEWMGGGGQWSSQKAQHVALLVARVRTSERLRTVLAEEGAGDIVRALVS